MEIWMMHFITMLMDFIVTIVFDLMIFVVIFHFLLEITTTQYHHPLRQFILRYTQPLLDPLHKVFPVYRNIDTALIALMLLLEWIKIVLLLLLAWQFANLALLLVWSILLILNSFVNFYFFAILFRLIISWIIPVYSNNPASQILFIITEPLLRPLRQRVRITGFDWTPLLVIIILKIISTIIIYLLTKLGAPAIIL